VDAAFGFVEAGEQFGGQGLQAGFFLREERFDLLTHGAVDAFVGDLLFPLVEEEVLFGEALEGAAFERVVLNVFYGGFDFAFVLWGPGLGRQDHRAVVAGKAQEFRVEFGVEPIGLQHGGLEVVDDGRFSHAAEAAVGVFQTAQEALRVLMPDDFAVAFAREAKGGAKHVRSAAAPIIFLDPSALTEVHLHLFARRRLHAPEGQGRRCGQGMNEAFYRVVPPGKAVLGDQILMDAFGTEALHKRCLDGGAVRLAQAARAGGHFGWFCLRFGPGPGGHFGRF
jgi:hypothetical protein